MDRNYNLRRAVEKARNKDYEAACGLLKRILEENQEDIDAATLLIDVYWRMGNKEMSHQLMGELMVKYPNEPEVVLVYADLLRYENDFNKSEIFYKKALELFPEDQLTNHSDIYLNLGAVYWGQNRRKEALEAWKTACELDPNNTMAHENLRDFTNQYNEPKAPNEAFDNFYAYLNIQRKRWKERNGDLKALDDANDFLGLVQSAWNALPFKPLMNELSAEEKIKYFESIDIDFTKEFPFNMTWQALTAMACFGEKHFLEKDLKTDIWLNDLFFPLDCFPGYTINHCAKNPHIFLEPIISRLKKRNKKEDSYWALVTLGLMGQEKASDVLFDWLKKDVDFYYRDAAMWALRQIGGSKIVARALDIIQNDSSVYSRLFSYGILEGVKQSQVKEILLKQLSKDTECLGPLLYCLMLQNDPSILNELESQYNDYNGFFIPEYIDVLQSYYFPQKKDFNSSKEENWIKRFYPCASFGLFPFMSPHIIGAMSIKSRKKIEERRKLKKYSLEELKSRNLDPQKEEKSEFNKPLYWGLPADEKDLPLLRNFLKNLALNWISQENLTVFESASDVEEELADCLDEQERRYVDATKKTKRNTKNSKMNERVEKLMIERCVLREALLQGHVLMSDFVKAASET